MAAQQTVVDDVTVDDVAFIFKDTKRSNIESNWPLLVRAIKSKSTMADDRDMIIYMLATIAAENETFSPEPEKACAANSIPGRPFGKYDTVITLNKKTRAIQVGPGSLGNRFYPGPDENLLRLRHGDPVRPDVKDGERYRGRGYIQLTGRFNYTLFMKRLLAAGYKADLENDPDLASRPGHAETLFVWFIESRKAKIKKALAAGDYLAARKCVNGGGHGLNRFKRVFEAFNGKEKKKETPAPVQNRNDGTVSRMVERTA